jgi:hypothetical protein
MGDCFVFCAIHHAHFLSSSHATSPSVSLWRTHTLPHAVYVHASCSVFVGWHDCWTFDRSRGRSSSHPPQPGLGWAELGWAELVLQRGGSGSYSYDGSWTCGLFPLVRFSHPPRVRAQFSDMSSDSDLTNFRV